MINGSRLVMANASALAMVNIQKISTNVLFHCFLCFCSCLEMFHQENLLYDSTHTYVRMYSITLVSCMRALYY